MVAFNQNLYAFENYGPVYPGVALLGPVRQSMVRDGDGVFIEEGTTNLLTNPGFEAGTTGYTAGGTTPTIAQSVVRSRFGANCLRIVWPAGAAGASTVATSATVAATTITASAWVFVPVGAPAVQLKLSGTATATGNASTTNGKWERITVSATATAGSVTVTLTPAATALAGTECYTDAWQLEQKAYATSYADGDLATVWNAANSVYTQDFESGTTSGWQVIANCTIANSATAPYQGTKALRATATAAAMVVGGPNGTATIVGSRWYTSSMWVRASAARQLQATITWFGVSGTLGSPAAGVAVTAVAGSYVRVTVTGLSPVGATGFSQRLTSSDSVNADTFDIDAVRFEEGTGAGTYRWTGVEKASTSVRAAVAFEHAINPVPSTISIYGITRVGSTAAISGVNPVLWELGDGVNGFKLTMVGNGTTSVLTLTKFVGGVATTATTSVTAVTGDQLVWVARFDSSNLKISVSKNSAAVVTVSTATSTVPSAVSVINIGHNNAGTVYANMPTEQILVFNRVLSDTEVTNMAALTQEIDYNDTTYTGIIFAAAADFVRGTVQAVSSLGSGYQRASAAIPAYMELYTTPEGSNPDDDAATAKITVAAGTGIGEGQQVAFSVAGGQMYTVKRAFSYPGAYDELYVA